MTECKNCIFSPLNDGTCQKTVSDGRMCWQYEPVIKSYEDMRRESPALRSLEVVASRFKPDDYRKVIKPILQTIVGMMAKGAPKGMQTSWAWDTAFGKISEILDMQSTELGAGLTN